MTKLHNWAHSSLNQSAPDVVITQEEGTRWLGELGDLQQTHSSRDWHELIWKTRLGKRFWDSMTLKNQVLVGAFIGSRLRDRAHYDRCKEKGCGKLKRDIDCQNWDQFIGQIAEWDPEVQRRLRPRNIVLLSKQLQSQTSK